jgi:ATP-dependent DNA helicase DinG
VREKLKDANIVVLNHSLLLSDIIAEWEISKNVENLILDEAHSLEDVATESLKKRFSLQWFETVCDFILQQYIRQSQATDSFFLHREKLLESFSLFHDICLSHISKKYNVKNDYVYFLIQDSYFFQEDFLAVVSWIIKKLDIFIYTLKEKKELDIMSEISYLEDIKQVFLICFSPDSKKEFIPIMSYNERYGVVVEYTYLNIGDFLETRLWMTIKNVFLLSATMKIGESFDYMKNSLYLHKWFDFYSFESDFNYSKQATLLIPNDIGSIKTNFSQVSDFLIEIIEELRGNMLILFTSLSAIKNFYFKANLRLKLDGITLLAQSLFGSKFKILNLFQKKSHNSVIVGTDSFWEGVDLPWDDLQCLVIHKFPFLVPSDPIFEARSKLYKDSFSEYSLPKAIIKLKQGFGRLIRTKTDTGIILLLDDRIFSTKWGKEFFKSFPSDINVKILKQKEILDFLKIK